MSDIKIQPIRSAKAATATTLDWIEDLAGLAKDETRKIRKILRTEGKTEYLAALADLDAAKANATDEALKELDSLYD